MKKIVAFGTILEDTFYIELVGLFVEVLVMSTGSVFVSPPERIVLSAVSVTGFSVEDSGEYYAKVFLTWRDTRGSKVKYIVGYTADRTSACAWVKRVNLHINTLKGVAKSQKS